MKESPDYNPTTKLLAQIDSMMTAGRIDSEGEWIQIREQVIQGKVNPQTAQELLKELQQTVARRQDDHIV